MLVEIQITQKNVWQGLFLKQTTLKAHVPIDCSDNNMHKGILNSGDLPILYVSSNFCEKYRFLKKMFWFKDFFWSPQHSWAAIG